jgi:hypothetical protein
LLVSLTPDQHKALEQFVALKLTLGELRQRLRGAVEIDFEGDRREVTEHFEIPNLGIRVEKRHIENALDEKRRGQLTEKELSDWAAVLVMIHAYDWQGNQEDEIAGWLHDLSYLPGERE